MIHRANADFGATTSCPPTSAPAPVTSKYRALAVTCDNSLVPFVPNVFVNQQEIAAGVQRAANALGSTVVRIRYDIGSDWTGDPSIFFRIILTDEAAKKPKLNEIANAIALILTREVKADEHGLHSYFNFRSASEQAALNEPAWA